MVDRADREDRIVEIRDLGSRTSEPLYRTNPKINLALAHEHPAAVLMGDGAGC
jgi:hypothetical protein